MFYQLPPAGNRLCLSDAGKDESGHETAFSPYDPVFYDSGTASLAAAIGAAIRYKQAEKPEVVLPAYGCPDLVSAAVFAGAKPVLVDLQVDRPWMNLEQLSASINSNTVAVVAVDLLGIPERIAAIRSIVDLAGVLLIEDSAQAFPLHVDELFWGGDLVVLSFGRGKPVTLLGGGAVLVRDPALGKLLPEGTSHYGSGDLIRLMALIYNFMSSPYLYWIPQGLPFLRLGDTRYHPLTAIESMDAARLRLLDRNISDYQHHTNDVQAAMADIVKGTSTSGEAWVDLPAVCRAQPHRRLLRYPLLVQAERRDRIYHRLRKTGLGPSLLYPSSLPRIPGLKDLLSDQGNFPAAEAFAGRILTLPTHDRVRQADIRKIREIFLADNRKDTS
ncbi:MAG: DegT/DnrJ/EryC1/StrS family aminotransferase [Gammaproteobacteria bacterium]